MSDKVTDTIDRLAEMIGQEAGDLFAEQLSHFLHPDMTPIEQMMGAALFYLLESGSWYGSYGFLNLCLITPIDGILEEKPTRDGINVFPQQPIGKYRADFLVRFAHWRGGYVLGAIECDGHNHHDLTKDQAVRDRARDRHFQSLGIIILRYPGSEIWKAPLKAAADALSILETRSGEPTAPRWKEA